MSTKDELVSNIREWMQIDGEIKQLQGEIKKRREAKKGLTTGLVEIMKEHDIDCFDVKNGKLIFTQNKVKAPLNKKTLLTALERYFPAEPQKAQDLSEYILQSRQENIKESIRLKSEK